MQTLHDTLQQAAVWCEDSRRELQTERGLREQREVSAVFFRGSAISHTALPAILVVSLDLLMPGCLPACSEEQSRQDANTQAASCLPHA